MVYGVEHAQHIDLWACFLSAKECFFYARISFLRIFSFVCRRGCATQRDVCVVIGSGAIETMWA